MPDVKEVVNGLEMSYKYSNVDENNTLVPQWIVLHAIALLKEYERAIKHQSDHLDALLKAQEPIDAIPMDWMDAQIHGYASALKSTELKALIVVKGLWEKEQEAQE